MPAAPPTYRQFVIDVSMIIVSAIVAIEKKMPCMRKVRRPSANPMRRADGGCGGDLHGKRRANRLDQKYRRVDAHAEKRAGAEIHVTGIAAKNAPCDGEYDELQDHVSGKERILVADDLRHQQRRRRETGPLRSRRKCRCGFMNACRTGPAAGRRGRRASIANEMAGAQEAPNRVRTIVSATPRMMAATSVPLMLPSPAMTTTQNVRPI